MELGWQFVLLGFGVWFTWFFVGNRLWIFFLSFAVYAATLYLWRKVREYLYVRFAGSRTVKYVNRIIFWSLPPLILFGLFRRLDNPNLVGTVGVLWAFCIAVYVTSGYLFEKDILSGRLGDTREYLSYLDVLVDGRFVEAQHDISLRFRGSSNQRLLDVPKSLAAKAPVWWEDEQVFATHTM